MNATEISKLLTPRTDALDQKLGSGLEAYKEMRRHARRLERENAALIQASESIARYPMKRDDELTIEAARVIIRKTLDTIKQYQEGK